MGKKTIYVSHSAEETFEAGRELAVSLKPGDIVYLFGELGSGKTVFVKGICRGLDVEEEATSPSFVIATEYTGRVNVSHIDLYRLDGQAAAMLPVNEYIITDGVTVIEWAERLGNDGMKGIIVHLNIKTDHTRELIIEDLRH